MKKISNVTLDAERALYGEKNLCVTDCRFEGPADGESALKECDDVTVTDSVFSLRYPLWHCRTLSVRTCDFNDTCRAAFWYCDDVKITGSNLLGTKALRESRNIVISECTVVSDEFGWFCDGIFLCDATIKGVYPFLRSSRLNFKNFTLSGKYSFQYIKNSVFEDCIFDTKDAFWHAENVTVKNSVVKGEYLGWYSKNLTFENCEISGTQPLCYCQNLKLINCTMNGCDLSFEKSDVNALILSHVDSVKNPASGEIILPSVGEIIMDDPSAKGKVIIKP